MPELVSMFPLSNVLFPYSAMDIHVFEYRYRVMIEACLDGSREFGVALIARGSEVGGGDERTSTGTRARIELSRSLPDGRFLLRARGGDRLRVVQWLEDDPHPRALVEPLVDAGVPAACEELLLSASAQVTRARALLSELQDVPSLPEPPRDPKTKVWWLCEQAPIGALDRQRLLECGEAIQRLRTLEKLAREVADDLARLLSSG